MQILNKPHKSKKTQEITCSAKDEEVPFEEIPSFKQLLAEVDAPGTETASITGKIVGVQQIVKTVTCVSCKRKVIPCTDNGNLGECELCKLSPWHFPFYHPYYDAKLQGSTTKVMPNIVQSAKNSTCHCLGSHIGPKNCK